MSIPWCSNGNIMLSRVVSWPPCNELVDVNTVAGLPAIAPDIHRFDVESIKYFNAAAIFP
jgi:hypothetical protein